MSWQKYVCKTCDKRFDFYINRYQISRDIKCPRCGSGNLEEREAEDSEGCEVYTTRESS